MIGSKNQFTSWLDWRGILEFLFDGDDIVTGNHLDCADSFTANFCVRKIHGDVEPFTLEQAGGKPIFKAVNVQISDSFWVKKARNEIP